jgi:hypothetical protein
MPSAGWLWAIVGTIVIAAAGTIGLMLAGSSLQAEADVYYSSFDYNGDGPAVVEIDPDKDRYYGELSAQGSQLFSAALPLLQVSTAGPFVLLAVLAARGDARPRVRATAQAEAPAGS